MNELSHEAIELLDSWVAEDKRNRKYEYILDCNNDIEGINLHWTFVCDDLRYSKCLTSSLHLQDIVSIESSNTDADGNQRSNTPQDNIDKLFSSMLNLKLDLMKIKIDSANDTVKRYKEAVRPIIDLEDRLEPLTKLSEAMHKIEVLKTLNAMSINPIFAAKLPSLMRNGSPNSVTDNDVLKPIKKVVIRQLDDDLS